MFLSGNSLAMAEEPWAGIFTGQTVLEDGVTLPEGLTFDDQSIEFECVAEPSDPPFSFIGYCTVRITYSVYCGSYIGTETVSNPRVDENISLDDLGQGYIESTYSVQDNTWTGTYYFDVNNMGCDLYPNIRPFSVSFTLHSQKNKVLTLTPIYQILL